MFNLEDFTKRAFESSVSSISDIAAGGSYSILSYIAQLNILINCHQ